MNRNQIRTILIIAIVLYCIGCAVACHSDRRQVKQDTLSIDTTDNDWIKDHSEIKNLDE